MGLNRVRGRSVVRMALLVALAITARQAAAVTITGDEKAGWRIEGRTYVARVGSAGDLVSLQIDKTEILAANDKKMVGASFPGGKADSVSLREQIIAARNKQARVEYSFDDTGVGVETEGAAWGCQIINTVTAFVTADGTVRPGNTRGLGEIRRIIVGGTGLELSEPFHCVNGRLFASAVPSGRKKADDLLKFRIECGISADATALIELREFLATGRDARVAPWYKEGQKAQYSIELANLGAKDRSVALAYTVGDHFVGGKTSRQTVLPAITVKANQTAKTSLEVAADSPGCWWVNLELRVDGKAVKRERRAFVYAGEKYLPPLTRPADFQEFWRKQLAALRSEAMDASLKEVPEKGTAEVGYYTLSLKVKGKRYSMALTAPRKAGKYMAIFGGKIGEKASDANHVIVTLQHGDWPEQATYTRWASASDNNLLDCYLVAVRITDYLRGREDVERIYLSGGSRQGAIQLVNAALDPTKICATEPHVPTCLGISWTEYDYKGWGKVPSPATMAAYVDPVNFAPDMTVPFIVDLGAYDGLSPAPGGLAFFNYATKAKWKRFSVELGGHGYFTSDFKKKAKAELEEVLKGKASVGTDDRVLKEH